MSRSAPHSKPPHGCKLTELGYIPEDWSITPLGQLIHSVEYGSSAKSDSKGEIPVLRMGNLQGGHIDWDDLVYTSDAREISRYSLQAGDVLFNRTNTIDLVGKTSLYDGEHEAIFAGYLIRIKVVAERLDARFVNYILNTPFARRHSIKVASLAVGQANINAQKLKTYPIPLPPTMKEQRAIVEALSDVDMLSDALEMLIAKKRAIKQAAMQQLLTGKIRLPGFSGKWEAKRLGDTAILKARIGWQGLTTAEYLDSGDFYLVTGTEFDRGYIDWKRCHFVDASRYKQDKHIQLKSHDVLVTKDGTIGKVALILDLPAPATLNSGVFVIRPVGESFHPEFFYHLLCSSVFEEFLNQLSAGSTINHLYQKDFVGFRYRTPPSLDEQAEIAAILADMDTEIIALESRREKTRQIKQGMMQQLLTGHIRLVNPGVAADEKAMAQTCAVRQANVHFVRSVLAAEIIDQLHEQPTFGHVKFEKMMFLVEHLCEVETGSTYRRQAAGPYDNRALRSIDSQLRAQQWFDARKEGRRYQYVPMQKRGDHKRYFDRYFSGIGETFDKIIGAFKTLDTERCEIVATLLAAWSDLLRDKGTVSDELVVHEVLNNWHEAKRRISEDRWLKALGWMRSQGFVPKGAS
ncbi:MAG: restriction endonuclease subunit S [Steroidobacteraceae bacterium]